MPWMRSGTLTLRSGCTRYYGTYSKELQVGTTSPAFASLISSTAGKYANCFRERLGDWGSPAILLRRFWDARVKDAPNSAACELALQAICRRMVETRSMAVSMKEMTLSEGAAAIRDLRSGGILQAPPSLYGMS